MLKRIQPIEGFEDYAITEDGKVWSFKRNKWLKPININGYSNIKLCKNGIVKRFGIHQIVANIFIPNPDNKPQIDHINCIKSDNNINNLRWVTQKENNYFAWRNGLKENVRIAAKINVQKAIKVTMKKVQCIETGKIFESAVQASIYLNFNKHAVTNALYKNTLCGGFRWKYVED